MNINLTKPSIDEKELTAVNRVMQSGWLIRGKETAAFEEELARYTGAKHAIATNGCTMALYLVVKHMNLKPTDEVIVPSLTWSATASIVIQAGATPVFADVKRDTWTLDPEDVKRKITANTKLVIPVHYSARYADGFENFPVPVLFDSAHRIEPNSFNGITSCFSFYAVKNMTTVRGGAIITDDDEAAAWYRMACHGGIAKDTLSRYNGTGGISASSFYYEVEVPGWNFDMTDVEAAIGREQLKKVAGLNEKRNHIVATYNKAFGLNITGNHMYPILVENRDEFLVKMKEAGIQCSIHYLPLHLMKGYAQYKKDSLPNTEFIGSHCVSLPLYPDLAEEEVNYIIENTKKFGAFIK
jgi:perosamine synthetase